MRHGKKINHLGRQYGHRQALLSNMASSLLISKRITTTVAKAKALRTYVEPLITRSKDDSTHSRRIVFRYLQNKSAVTELFREIAPKVSERPGGYTRIIKTGNREGDNAEMCLMELVDFNTIYTGSEGKAAGKAKTTRRGRRKKATTAETQAPEASAASAETGADTAAAEEKPKKTSKKKKEEE